MACKRETWDGSAPVRRKAIRLIRDEIESGDLSPQDLARLGQTLAALEHSARQARRLRIEIAEHEAFDRRLSELEGRVNGEAR